MTRETLEEASLLSRPIHLIWDEDERYDCNEEFREEFKKGAKWQQERSYSKEDMIEFAYNYIDERRDQGARAMTPELLIKQFKNK